MRHTLLALTGLALIHTACTDVGRDAPLEPSYPGGMTLIQTVEKAGDEIVIPFKKFRLPNGLTLILHEDRSDPLVHVDVTYHVGSAREDIGKSGFAHFFEHMMFQGSQNVADEEHFKIISEAGGTLNGTTNNDRTNYFETVPSNQLEKMLWLEADRMGFFLDAVTQEKFEVQRETVKNERGQRVDNRPYGLLNERVGEAMYPEGHPYSWSVIGYLEDLDRADLNDLKKFFLRWYGPNNATLTIGGRFDEAETLAWVAKYFGSIPTGPGVEKPEFIPVSLDGDRYISLADNIVLPLVYMAWPTVHARHPDEAPLDVLMSILGSGRTSLLYKNLVKDGLAVQAEAGHACREIHCQFTLFALANPSGTTPLSQIEDIIRGSLEEFETRGVQNDDLIRVKTSIVSGMIYGLESVAGKVSQLAANETFTGDPNYIGADIARYENVTAEDVVRVYNQYIKDKPAVVMSIVPKDQPGAVAAPDTWKRYERTLPETPTEESGLELRPASDTFDRSIRPSASSENPAVTLPEIWRGTLSNSIKVLGAVNNETPTTAIRFRIEAAQKNEPLEKLGLAALTAEMMNEATLRSSNEDLSNRLDKLGSSIRFSAGDTFTDMTIRSLTANLDETLAIAAEKLMEPAFDPADFTRLKAQLLQGIESEKKNASSTASNVYRRLIYGENNAFAYPDAGTSRTVAGLTLEDVKAFYEAHYSASLASIVAVSDLSDADMTAKLGVFSGLEAKPVAEPRLQTPPDLAPGTLYLVDKPDAAQSEIRIGKRGLPFDATGPHFRAGLMNFTLGGAFNSRINLNLREDKGYTYGAYSYFRGDKDTGEFTSGAGVRTDATVASLQEFSDEITNFFEKGLTEADLAFTKSAIGQRDARSYETPSQKLRFLEQILTYDLEDDFVDQQAAILENATLEELNAIAAEKLNVDEMIIVVVGDKSAILPELQSLGYDIVELDEDGNLLEE